ncbi:MAG: cupin domain-containing protein [Chloroflexota bacterium]|jgi:quercetin dioxygenase-like cupin family protein|nr:cupin domain-containing protein [Chloroflexota bacterium]
MPIANIDATSTFAPEKMQKNGLFASDQLFCDVYCLEPGQEQRVHVHQESDKIYHVFDGAGVFTLGDEESEQVAGDVIHSPAGIAHGVANRSAARLRCLVVIAPPPRH